MPTVAELEARAVTIRAENKKLSMTLAHHPEKETSPVFKGQPSIDSHVVVFHDTWEHVFTGADAAKVAKTLEGFSAANAGALADERADPDLKVAVRTAREYTKVGADGTLRIRNQQFNAVLAAIDFYNASLPEERIGERFGVTSAGANG